MQKHDNEIDLLKQGIKDLDERKADQDEHERQRDHIVEIFKRLGSIDVSSAKTEAQIARFASDIESEKRTRQDVNREINQKLDRLIERREQAR